MQLPFLAFTSVAMVVAVVVRSGGGRDIRVLVMIPYQRPNGFKFAFGAELSGAAVQLAKEDIERSEILPNHRLLLDYVNSHCNVVLGLGTAADMLYARNYSVIIGPQCSQVCSHVARLGAYQNIPVFTGVCQDQEMANKGQFKTLTRFLGSFYQVGKAVIDFLLHNNWKRFSVVSERHVDKIWMFTKAGIENVAADQKLHLAASVVYKDRDTKYNENLNLTSILFRVTATSRIIVLAVRGESFRQFMLLAHEYGFTNGKFVFIVILYYRQEKVFGDFTWKQGLPSDVNVKRAYRHVVFLTYYTRESQRYADFEKRMRVASYQLFRHTFSLSDAIPYPAANLYEAMYMYALSVNITLGEGQSVTNGTFVSRRLWNTTYNSITGHLTLNDNGDREQGFTFSQMYWVHHESQERAFDFQSVGEYFSDVGVYQPSPVSNIIWAAGRRPSDAPKCGFENEFCQPMSRETLIFIILGAIVLMLVVTVVILFIGFYYYKRNIKVTQIETIWRIHQEDLVFGCAPAVSVSRLTMGSYSNTANHKDSNTALYKGSVVAVKIFKAVDAISAEKFKKEYYEITQLNCVNVVKVYGFHLGQECLMLSEFCKKGSLPDLLENSTMTFDNIVKFSFINDTISGLSYLHESPLGYHGNLKSSNCVVDGRFTVKLTDFGPRSWIKTNSYRDKDLLWSAPEILRNQMPPTAMAWRMADVYSLSIIMPEIWEQNGVFYTSDKIRDPEEIIQLVRKQCEISFRPSLDRKITPPSLVTLISDCWADSPTSRPTIKIIKRRLKQIQGPQQSGVIDNLLHRMEQYATNLESLVAERTGKYLQEKKRVEELLYSILPRSIADQLQAHGCVAPEAYDSVTILFTDIKGFTDLSAQSTPMQIVNLLNDLYTLFDATIEKYDAYKVETIGDAYMVVSGLPKRNTDHYYHIADLALELMDCVKSFHISHMPEQKLLLRAGIHSGACVAGVVGLKMPRYCLFGDTVNTASRMESTGDALKIHVSQSTKECLETANLKYTLNERGTIAVKGKGDMTTYWLMLTTQT